MNLTDNLLRKEPYLNSYNKPNRSHSALRNRETNLPSQINNQMRRRFSQYDQENNILDKPKAANSLIVKKLLDYNKMNAGFHEAIKIRNANLNNALQDVMLDRDLAYNLQNQNQYLHISEKNNLVARIEEQTNQIIHLKKTLSITLDAKTQLENQLSHLRFIIENENSKAMLQVKEHAIRLQNSQRTYKELLNTRDQQINHLNHRLRIYEDQNKRLNQINRILQLSTIQNRLDNFSRINPANSSQKPIKIQLSDLKPNRQPIAQQNSNFKSNRKYQQPQPIINIKNQKVIVHDELDQKRIKQLLQSIVILRNGINDQVFNVFFKSIKQGERLRQNSLVIFISNWKILDVERLQPYLKSYNVSRTSLKKISSKDISKQLYSYLQQILPINVQNHKNRSQINQWILNTIQFTKNQKQSSKNTLNNAILFLFRLLTIEYRITYPLQGKSFQVDKDIRNQLLHQIIIAVELILSIG